jgi:hypothetical protein
MLQIRLALNGVADVVVPLEVDEALQSVALREAFDRAFAALEGAPRQVGRHADVEHAVGVVRHDVDPAALHPLMLPGVDGRDEPGHDDLWRPSVSRPKHPWRMSAVRPSRSEAARYFSFASASIACASPRKEKAIATSWPPPLLTTSRPASAPRQRFR